MNARNIAVYAAILFAVVGCTPSHLVRPTSVPEDKRLEILVFREREFNASAGMVLGANDKEYALLDSGDYLSLYLPAGDNKIFARATNGDKPFVLPISSGDRRKICIKATGDPANFAKGFVPFIHFLTSFYVLKEFECPSEDEVIKYNKVTLRYL